MHDNYLFHLEYAFVFGYKSHNPIKLVARPPHYRDASMRASVSCPTPHSITNYIKAFAPDTSMAQELITNLMAALDDQRDNMQEGAYLALANAVMRLRGALVFV